MSRKGCEAEPSAPSSQSLLEEAQGSPSQETQATSSGDWEPLGSHSLSHGAPVASEYLPFFRTGGRLLTEELCRDHRGGRSVREEAFPEDSQPPSGFCPYQRSEEETFPSLALPGKSRGGSRDPPPRREVETGCFCTTMASDGHSTASPAPSHAAGSPRAPACCPHLVSAGRPPASCLDVPLFSDATFVGHAFCAAGFVPYYRSPEEGICTSPGPPASPPAPREPSGGQLRPGSAPLRGPLPCPAPAHWKTCPM
ncbi:uncharacterized protein LOC143664453 [Tamandua tetradactyla]|uniref:uncharacterized protein LOC143664453 n=1 Tax=Tamandua tetradactyla TaxID=48850 RepID=UPI004053C140